MLCLAAVGAVASLHQYFILVHVGLLVGCALMHFPGIPLENAAVQ